MKNRENKFRKEPFFAGVIEGFYGQPWSQAERIELINWMSSRGLNTYLYAPKDDLYLRAIWRELHPTSELRKLRRLLGACRKKKVRFMYALSPGLDLRYTDQLDLDRLKRKMRQLLALGCRDFALLFDDIPERMNARDAKQFGSLASAQSFVMKNVFKWLTRQFAGVHLLFCPTPYCGRMAKNGLGGGDYLATIGRELPPEIGVFWTGPEIVSREIPITHIKSLTQVLRRKPIIWDNLHANDYDGRRFYCGPYSGRPLALRGAVQGILCNPNNEFPLNFVPLQTFAQFIARRGIWNPRQAYVRAIREWFCRFEIAGPALVWRDFVTFGDCFYLPHEEGPEANELLASARAALNCRGGKKAGRIDRVRRRVDRLMRFCAQLSNLTERSLFYALSRRVWELREELDLLGKYLEFTRNSNGSGSFRSDFHLAGTYRGGMILRMQRLLVQDADGALTLAKGC